MAQRGAAGPSGQDAKPARKYVSVCGPCGAWNLLTQLNKNFLNSRFTLRQSCAMDAETQALILPRSGTLPSGASDWVKGGGIVITEYSNSAAVYNKVFGGNVKLPNSRLGNCYDAVMPLQQLSPNDPFWANNKFDPPAQGKTACGYDMRGYPGLTALGGWGGGSVGLAYKTLGGGRVWFLEEDWQDAEGFSSLGNGRDGRLMASMIVNGAKV
jgi:hypothetical protein